MDRNLYERANDCRWWALTSFFKEAFDDTDSIIYKRDEISSILKYINDLYTVYTNILVFDKSGKVIAVSNEKEKHLVGKVLTQDWVEKTLTLKNTSKYCVSKFEKTPLYNDESTYIYCSAIRSVNDENKINGGIAVVFDSKPQFKAMLDDTLPKNINGEIVEGTFAVFTSRDKKIISSTNENLEVDSFLNLDDSFFTIENGHKFSKIVELGSSYYAIGVRCSSGYREYKSRLDDYKNDILSFVFIKIGKKRETNHLPKEQNRLVNNIHKKKNINSVELATFYIGKKFLAVDSKNVVEAIGIDELQTSIDMDKSNHFKGMVLHKERLIAVLDIRDFINEDVTDEDLTNIIIFEYDNENIHHCVGILTSSLEHISLVERNSIQYIQNHFLGSGTLVESLVDISDYEKSKVAMLLNIQKIDANLTQKVA